MILKTELKSCQCNDTPDEYRARLIKGLLAAFPGRTIDNLVCTPSDALKFCERIRKEVGSESLHDVVILKPLMNIRKRKDCPTGLKSKQRRQKLSDKLADVGCDIEEGQFREIVSDCLADMYKSRTVDEVVCYPREAMAFCNYVRNFTECDTLTDVLILTTLMNNRKSPY